MKVDERVTIEVERDMGLRAREYQVTTFDREGNPASGFLFVISDVTGRIVKTVGPIDMTEEETHERQ